MDHQPASNNMISMVESVLRQASGGPSVWQRQHMGFVDHRSASTSDLSMIAGGTSVASPSIFSEQRALSPGDEHYDALNDNDNGSEDSPSSSDSGGCGSKKGANARPNRDPMSHRIIEKRRRDRMNNCLTNLSKLIPSSYLKKGRGRIEKTEIIEMAIRYMRSMQEERKRLLAAAAVDQPKTEATCSVKDEASATTAALLNERYKQGFYDCIAETLRFLAGADGLTINEATKTHLLMHLRDYFSQLICDILGAPIIAQLLQISQVPSSLQHSPQHSIRSRSLSFDRSITSTGHHEDDQPLNMSLKKPRLDQPSHLRHILTDAKADAVEVRRPHVFRYASELSKLSPACELKPSLPHSLGASAVSAASGSTHYPSSPSSDSQQSLSGGSSAGDSPPRVVSPFPSSSSLTPLHQLPAHLGHAGIPVFALHSSGMFYVPLTLSASQIDQSYIHRLTSTMGACHPVTITVSFCNSPTNADCGPHQAPTHLEPDTTKN